MEQSSGCSKNLIITELFNNSRVNYLIKIKAPKGLHEDFKQELFLFLAEMEESKLIEIHNGGGLIWYVCRVILNMASSTGQFRYKYREPDFDWYIRQLSSECLESIDPYVGKLLTDEYLEKLKINEEGVHDSILLNSYLALGSCESVSKLYNLPQYHVYKTIKKSKEELKKYIRNAH